MPQLLLVHEDKRLLRDESYLQHVSETYGIEVHQIAWEDDTPALKALFDSIVAQQPPLLWVLFLSFRVTPFQDFEGPFLSHSGPPFVVPMLLGTNQFEAIFSEKFQNWWRERWEIVLRQDIPGFEGFWNVPDVPVGIISEPFRSERDFDGYLFPWIKRWDTELDPGKLFGTERRLVDQWARRARKPKRDSRPLYALLVVVALIAAGAGSVYAQRQGKLLEAIFIIAAVVLYIITFAIVRYAFSRPQGYLHIKSTGERRSATAYNHGRGLRILILFAALILLIVAGGFLVTSYGRLRNSAAASLIAAPRGIADKTQITTPTLTGSPVATAIGGAASNGASTEEASTEAAGTEATTLEPRSTSTTALTMTATSRATSSPTATRTPQASPPAFAPTNTKASGVPAN